MQDLSWLPDPPANPPPTRPTPPSGSGSADLSWLPDPPTPAPRAASSDLSWLPDPPQEDPSLWGRVVGVADVAIPAALRVGGGIVGALGAGLAAAPTGPGAVAAASAGGAGGSMVGDFLAQHYEKARGLRDDVNLTQTAIEGAVGAVPFFGKAGRVAKTALSRGAQGALLNTAADVAQQTLAEGTDLNEVDLGRAAGAAALGGVLGSGAGAAEAKLLRPRASVVPDAPRPDAPTLPDAPTIRPEPAVTDTPQVVSAADTPPRVQTDVPSVEAPPRQAPDATPPALDEDAVRTARPTASPEAERAARAANQPGIPPRARIAEDDLVTEKMVARFPEEQRDDLLDVITRNKGFEQQRRGVQPNARTEALAQHISMDLTEKLRPGTILNAEETLHLANTLAGVNDRIQTLAQKVADNAAGGVTDEWDNFALAQARNDQAVLIASYLGTRAEQGRALQSHRIMAQILRSGDLEGLRKMFQAHPGLRDIEGFAEEFLKRGTDIEKMQFVRDTLSQKMTLGDKALAVYYANILSGVKTHLRNLFGTGANIAFREASMAPALAFDVARSKITGAPRTIFARELPHRVAGAWQGLRKGLHDAAFVLRHGFTRENVSMFDTPRVELAGGAANPFNLPGRLLEAEDQLMYRMVYEAQLAGRLYAQGRAHAAKAGATGTRADEMVGQFVADGILNPPKQVAEAAAEAARQALFREDPGQFVQWLLGKKNAGAMGKAVSFIVPFVKVPANILRQSIENTLPGMVTAQGRRTLAAGGREAAELVGRATTGTAALGLLATWVAQGRVSGAGPSDPNARAALMETGWKPYSVQIPGVGWVDYNLIAQPVAIPLAMLANAWESYVANEGEVAIDDIAVQTVLSLGSTMLDQSFLSGVADFNAAMTNPEQYAKNWAARTAQGFVPMSGLSRNIAQTIDPVVRDVTDPSLVRQTVKGIQSVIPGVSDTLPARLDRFGRPVVRTGGRAAGMLPVTVDEGPRQDPVISGLQALGITSIGLPPRTIGRKGSRTSPLRTLTHAERARVGQATREALERLFETSLPQLQRMDPTAAEMRVRRVVDEARSRVYREIQRQGRQTGAQ